MAAPTLTHECSKTIFRNDLTAITLRTDRIFFWLLIGQWLGGIITALVWSPRTWIAQYWSVHQHVIAAALLGALFAVYPLYLIIRRPGAAYTRHMIAVGQMLQSALLVHVTGGRIETHFHVFGSLAILAFYRDWRVLMTGAAVVYVDHLALGAWFPLSVYGVAQASIWRSIEHAIWVMFEVVFLMVSCRTGIRELCAIAERQAEVEDVAEQLQKTNAEVMAMSHALQHTNRTLEARVQERTQDLQRTKESLELEVKHRTKELEVAKESLELNVARRTEELSAAKLALEQQIQQLEVLNRVMMGREERIVDLKEELRVLKCQQQDQQSSQSPVDGKGMLQATNQDGPTAGTPSREPGTLP